MFKRIVLSLFICLTLGTLISAHVFADNADIYVGDCNYVLGLTSWDCGVKVSNQESLKSGVWTIAANVATDITVVATYLALGFVIYGGYLYIFSGGEAGRITTSKKVLPQAFIGLFIVLTANVIFSSIRIAMIGTSGNFGNCVEGCINPTQMVSSTISWVVGIAGAVAAIFVVYGGISYVISSGDPQKLQRAKQIILYALIGLAVVALAEIITAFASNAINDAAKPGGNALYINQTTISKEVHDTKIN